jgi:hypothetical protein
LRAKRILVAAIISLLSVTAAGASEAIVPQIASVEAGAIEQVSSARLLKANAVPLNAASSAAAPTPALAGTGPGGNFAQIVQQGSGNEAAVLQSGIGNAAVISQIGRGNTAMVVQRR